MHEYRSQQPGNIKDTMPAVVLWVLNAHLEYNTAHVLLAHDTLLGGPLEGGNTRVLDLIQVLHSLGHIRQQVGACSDADIQQPAGPPTCSESLRSNNPECMPHKTPACTCWKANGLWVKELVLKMVQHIGASGACPAPISKTS